jgi:hypothetical protein
VDAELCPSEIQDLVGNIVDGKPVAKTELKMLFGFELGSLNARHPKEGNSSQRLLGNYQEN